MIDTSAWGLPPTTLQTLRTILHSEPRVERAILFDHPALREHIERVGQVLYERPLSDR
jgi:hypothetical protein